MEIKPNEMLAIVMLFGMFGSMIWFARGVLWFDEPLQYKKITKLQKYILFADVVFFLTVVLFLFYSIETLAEGLYASVAFFISLAIICVLGERQIMRSPAV